MAVSDIRVHLWSEKSKSISSGTGMGFTCRQVIHNRHLQSVEELATVVASGSAK